jgi:UDP-N-acetylmuramoyl-tripeptide--D-alanyl-D-alanine ligase
MAVLIAAFVTWLLVSAWHTIDLLQFFQQHEYLSGRFLQWSVKRWSRVIYPVEFLALAGILAGRVMRTSWVVTGWFTVMLWLVGAGIGFFRWRSERQKVIKPLVYTARIKRLLAAAIITAAVEAAVIFWITDPWLQSYRSFPFTLTAGGSILVFYILCLWLHAQLTPLNIVLANGLAFPVEEASRQRYIREAREKIDRLDPIVIGITGSYGKTSTKEILAHLLGSKYAVLKTPKTFNTILGVCKVIREDLKPEHRYFIVEMGAYKPGEIARICDLVHPKIGILTAVGPQHLERFGSVETIARAKYELIEALPADGVAIFNGDDEICRQLAEKTQVKTLRYGMQPESPSLDLRAATLITSDQGTSFELQLGAEPALPSRTQLLGRHNVTNTLGAVLTATECGLSLKDAVRAIASLTPLEHRLQVVRAAGGIITLDNAYNSNPSGAKVALEVLASFQSGQKVLVTPGFAELGAIQAEEHRRLGENAAGVCDYIFLIGDPVRTGEILAGVQSKGFDPQRVFCYERLAAAKEHLRSLLQPGDVVLFENDLIDIY